MRRTVWCVMIMLLMSSMVLSQEKIAPVLRAKMDLAAKSNTPVKALIMLEDRLDIRALDAELYKREVDLQTRAYEVITALKDKAAETQGELLNYLEAQPRSEVVTYEAFWIANIIAVDAVPGVIVDISKRADVHYIQIDSELEWDRPVESSLAEESIPNGVEPGLRAINAHLMWEAGFTGAGVIVMGVDTGIDVNHPALSWKWRGNNVPANQAWFDPETSTASPTDCDNHGTHTMGTMTGLDPATNDTIGVAFGAEWIGAKTICAAGAHTSRSIAAFEWAVDPDGNPATADDMPVGINNSWWDPNITSSTQCNPLINPYIDVVTAVEAAGIAIVFSAGNSGPGGTSVTTPKNVNFDLVDFWATGALDANNVVAGFSSRGPVVNSCITGNSSLDIKPEASAPGVAVRSSIIGGGYGNLSGTSMAAPHVVGALALLREAHPGLTGRELKLALYNTARDLGPAGEDNDYGMGIIDVYAAHLSLADPTDPNPPENVTAFSDFNTPTSIALTWDDPTNYFGGDTLLPDAFEIDIYRDAALVASVAGGTESYNDSLLTDGQFYEYTVMARDTLDSLSRGVDVSAYAGGSPIPAAPSDFACEADTVQAILTWVDPTTQSDGTTLDDLDSIFVYRNDSLIAMIEPGVQTYTDIPEEPGFVYRYSVKAKDSEDPANFSAAAGPLDCFVGSAPNFLIWQGADVVGQGAESGDSLLSALIANGEGAFLTDSLFEFGADLSIYEGIFVVLGIYPDNHEIEAGDPEGPALESYLNDGGRIFLEAGDAYNFDPEFGGYNIRPWFDLDDGPDGSADLSGVIGVNDMSAFSFSYSGHNNFMDELQPVTSTAIWQNDVNIDISGVFYTGFGSGRSVGVVPSFAGFDNSSNKLNRIERLLDPLSRDGFIDGHKPPRPEREARSKFVKKAAPENSALKKQRAQERQFAEVTAAGVKVLANNKVDLMAAYLGLFRNTGAATIAVSDSVVNDSLLVNGTNAIVMTITNAGGSLAGDLTYTITENPDEAWLSVSPDSGTLGGNDVDEITLSFDANGLAAGDYSTTLEVASNDTLNPLLTVTVNLLVSDAPVIATSPDEFDYSLGSTEVLTDTLTITNNGAGPLDFTVRVAGAEGPSAKVDILAAGKAAKDDRVLARGTPVPLHTLSKVTPSLQGVGEADIDLTSVSQSGLSKLGGLNGVTLEGEEIFGSDDNEFGPSGVRGRGNLFTCTNSTTILEHRFYLDITAATDVYFVIAESDVQAGDYQVISVSNVSPQGPGLGWYSSGDISAQLVAGKYYLIFAQWDADASYFNGQNITPYPIVASFGELTAGAGWSTGSVPTYANPPADIHPIDATAFAEPVAYYQTIVTGTGADWVSIDSTAGVIQPGESFDVAVTFDANGLLGGDYYADIIVESNDPVTPFDTTSAHIFVDGTVSISANPDSLVFGDATFLNNSSVDSFWVHNGGNGVLSVTDISSDNDVFSVGSTSFDVQPFDSAAVYVTFTPDTVAVEMGTLTIASNDTGNVDLAVYVEAEAISPPVMTVDPDSILHTLNFGDSIDVTVSINNASGADLEWTVVPHLTAYRGGRGIIGVKPGVVSDGVRSVEETPDLQPNTNFPVQEAMWDLVFSFDLEAASGDLGNAGAEFDGTYYYTTRWASNLIHKYDVNGNLVEEFSIDNVTGLRDLAFDGIHMYGGANGNTIYQMDFVNKTLVSSITFTGTATVRTISYDEEFDAFWVSGFGTDIQLVARDGSVRETIPQSAHGFTGMYGSAYDPWSEGGPYLWLFDQGPGAGFPQSINQFDLNTNTLTGVSYDVAQDFVGTDGIAGGLFISEGILPGFAVVGGVLQGTPDNFFVYELVETEAPWMEMLSDMTGVTAAGESSTLSMRLRAMQPDSTLEGYLEIRSNDPLNNNEVVIVELGVEDDTTGISIGDQIPLTFDVGDNYPNPFNPTTTIEYNVPRSADVKLVIYNLLGQRVRTLVKERTEPGQYRVKWDGLNDDGYGVASGIYLYRFEAADFTKVKKMILLK